MLLRPVWVGGRAECNRQGRALQWPGCKDNRTGLPAVFGTVSSPSANGGIRAAGAIAGTDVGSVLFKSEHFARSGLITPSGPFTSCGAGVILDALSGFFQCFQPRKLEGPSPIRTVGLGSIPALPPADHEDKRPPAA